jgi:predicted permease
MELLWQNLAYGFRMMRKHPGFTAVAVLTLALGMGANTAIFSVVDGVLLRPLPYPHPEQLVRVTADLRKANVQEFGLSFNELFDFRDRAGIFQEVAGVWPLSANLTEVDQPERVELLLVDANYFEMLGAQAQKGRVFGSSDYRPGMGEVAVISDGLWRRRFGADPNIVGRKFRLDNDLYTIAGVTRAGFHHPGRILETEVEVWLPSGWLGPPFDPRPARKQRLLPAAIARLKPGIHLAEAQARMDSLGAALVREYPDDYPADAGWAPRLVPLRDDLVGNVRKTLDVLLAAVGVVLLIACVNVANLLLARATARQREIAVRGALGAGRGRIVQQLLTESILLALVGGVVAIPLAFWGVRLLIALSPANLPRAGEISLNLVVLAFTLALSLVTGIIFGLAPAWQMSQSDLQNALRESGRGAIGGSRGGRVRQLLVIAELGLALVLLASATLVVRSFWLLQNVDPGFNAHNLLTAQLWLPQPNNVESGPYFQHDRRVAFFREAIRRIRALPGVRGVGGTTTLPLATSPTLIRFTLEGEPPESTSVNAAESPRITPGYFAAMGIPLLRGRDFAETDDAKSPLAMVVNQTFVRKYFPDQNPIGQRIRQGSHRNPGDWHTIIGVVGDVRSEGLELEAKPQAYRSLYQVSLLNMTLVIRTAGNASGVAEDVRREISAVDPNEPLFGVRTMDQILAAAMAQRRFAMTLLGLFAATAVLLAGTGIYGVMSYLVAQRTQEIGIRMALGAQRGDVLGLVVGQGMRLALAGVAVGIAAALALTRMMSDLLYGVKPTDPATLAAVALLVAGVAFLACYVPARRATRVDPLVALRYE